MDGAAELHSYGAMDAALQGVFFMSFGVLGLMQLTSLFEGRPLRFATFMLCAGAVAQGFGLLDFAGWCAQSSSALICNHDARGLVALGMTSLISVRRVVR